MLVLERCKDESIIIDGCIEVKIVDVRKINGVKAVRLGITAPKSISIHRSEIQDRINMNIAKKD